jgi:hypothetical protein
MYNMLNMLNMYINNKKKYMLLNEMTMNEKLSMTGGRGDKNKISDNYKIIDNKEKSLILKKYDEIVSGDKKCTSYPRKEVDFAVSGIFINKEERGKKTTSELCGQIQETYDEGKDPYVHDDSLTAWGNYAAVRYGLTVGDIIKMKFGDKIDVIIFDRNVGDYTDGKKAGSKYEPKKEGCVYATYIHGEGITGILNMYDIGVVHAPFTWEINRKAIGDNMFWGPIDGCSNSCSKNRKKPINIYKINHNIKVGWRGPTILMSDAKKHLPKYVVHYDTWWDDYLPFKNMDLTKIKD